MDRQYYIKNGATIEDAKALSKQDDWEITGGGKTMEDLKITREKDGTEVYSSVSAEEKIRLLKERILGLQSNNSNSPIQHANDLLESASNGDIQGIIKAGVMTAVASLEHVVTALKEQEMHDFDELALRPSLAPDLKLDVDLKTDAIPDMATGMMSRK